MLKSPYLFAIGILVTLLSWTGTAKAYEDNLGLSFALPSAPPPPAIANSVQAASSPISHVEKSVEQTEQPPKQPTQQAAQETTDEKLIRYRESLPPLTETLLESEPAPANGPHQKDSIGLSFADNSIQMPAEAGSQAIQKGTNRDNTAEAKAATAIPVEFPTGNIPSNPSDPPSQPIAQQPAEPAYNTLGLDNWIFDGGSSSLVARTVGSAEGTRMSDGERTLAYYGHTDPGNGVWNLGTFSYQHGASTPEEADEKQLSRLRNQGLQLEEKAAGLGVKLSLEAKLNGIDLANQAPLAALDRGGYIERLAEANRLGMRDQKAILWARTYAYIDPNTQTWNAPGLGNNVYSISQDQERRALAISRALQAYDLNDGADSLAATAISADELLVTTADAPTGDLSEQRPSVQAEAYVALSFGLPPSNAEVIASITPPDAPIEAVPNSSQIDLAFQPAEATLGEVLERSEVLESAQDATAGHTLFGMEGDEYDDGAEQPTAETDASIEAIFDIPEEANSVLRKEPSEETGRPTGLSEGLSDQPSPPLVAEKLADSSEPSEAESPIDIIRANSSLPTAPTKPEEKSSPPARRELLWRDEDKIIRQK